VTAPSQPDGRQTNATVEQIPFRDSGAQGEQSISGALGVAVLLLVAAVGLLWTGKKKGWLARWISITPALSAQVEGMKVASVVRLSKHTVLYRIESGTEELVIVESDRSISVARKSLSMAERSHGV
jgi:hypothetical protein